MSIFSGFFDFLEAAINEPRGLDLVEETIDGVVKQIELQMAAIKPRQFEAHGTIQKASFGGADAAPNLSMHYSRAHEVTWKTLEGLKKDLNAFQEACRLAKEQVLRADEDSSQQLNRTRSAVELLEAGTTTGYGSDAHRRAQQTQDTTGGHDA